LKGLVDDKPNFKVPRFKRRSLGQRRRLAIGTVAIHTKPCIESLTTFKLFRPRLLQIGYLLEHTRFLHNHKGT
jgi:hypothetical protein